MTAAPASKTADTHMFVGTSRHCIITPTSVAASSAENTPRNIAASFIIRFILLLPRYQSFPMPPHPLPKLSNDDEQLSKEELESKLLLLKLSLLLLDQLSCVS